MHARTGEGSFRDALNRRQAGRDSAWWVFVAPAPADGRGRMAASGRCPLVQSPVGGTWRQWGGTWLWGGTRLCVHAPPSTGP